MRLFKVTETVTTKVTWIMRALDAHEAERKMAARNTYSLWQVEGLPEAKAEYAVEGYDIPEGPEDEKWRGRW